MKKIPIFLFALSIIGTAAVAAPGVGKPSGVQLTVYNQDFALVKEVRDLTLDKGLNFISVPDVAATIQADTVSIKSLLSPNSFAVREQNYQYDLVNPATILNKSVGKRVVVRRMSGGQVQAVEGTLLSSEGNGVVIQTADGILLNPAGEIQVMELPEGLVSRPTLVWKLESAKSGTGRAEISYLANRITWSAAYVAVIDPKDEHVDLTGWVTLSNMSGTTYENASLNLMAGDVNRIREPLALAAPSLRRESSAMKSDSQFTEKSMFEYHLYTLKDRTTVRNKEMKQISLLSASDVPVKKQYIYDGRKGWWGSWRITSYRPGESYDVSVNKKVNVFVELMNSKQNNLGMPLPKGIVRVYKSEEGANQHFIGEDSIDHTPKDEKIRLYLGDAFDIVGEHTRMNFKRIDSRTVEETFRITLRNHKGAPADVTAVEHLVGDWDITQSSHKYYKKDASTVEIPVSIPKDGEVQVTYTARTRW